VGRTEAERTGRKQAKGREKAEGWTGLDSRTDGVEKSDTASADEPRNNTSEAKVRKMEPAKEE
jgi:hypothetical protein